MLVPDSILRFALDTFGGSIHKTIEIALSLYLRNIKQRQRHDAPDEPCHDKWPLPSNDLTYE